MSTRSTIAKVQEDGQTIRSIYCHFDGYPEHVGKVLQEHYTNESKINQLLALGDISVLDKEIGDGQVWKTEYVVSLGMDPNDLSIRSVAKLLRTRWATAAEFIAPAKRISLSALEGLMVLATVHPENSTPPDLTRQEGCCFAYGRDRGETGIDALVHANQNEWLGFRKGSWCEYGYLWDGSSWHTFPIA